MLLRKEADSMGRIFVNIIHEWIGFGNEQKKIVKF